MPWYNDLRPAADSNKKDYALLFPGMTDTEKKRCINNLLMLRQGLDQEIAAKRSDQNLLLANWNVKEFGHTTQRLPEAYFYIAEILNRFDLIAIQEVKSSLKDLDIIRRLLGADWEYTVNDITEGNDGNSERSAYLFNKKRVMLSGISGEITLWDDLTKNSPIKQLKRTPYITGFKTGWKLFSLINVHLHPGSSNTDLTYRKEEVRLFLEAISYKLKNKRFWNENVIVLGDFNFYKGAEKDSPAIQLFFNNGFKEISSLVNVPTNASETEAYDRMFFNTNDYFRIQTDASGHEIGGVFNPFRYVYTLDNVDTYKSTMLSQYTGTSDLNDFGNLSKYYKHPWRKNQLSDHYPIWVSIITDSSDDFLRNKLTEFQS